MSYTMTLRQIIDVRGGMSIVNTDGVRTLDKPELLHMDTYPLHDEGHRTELNGLILDTFWNRQIAYETPDIFMQEFRVKMRTIMPTYNQLYASAKLVFNPLITTDMRNTSTQNSETVSERESSAQTSSESDSEQQSVSSDTPQSMLANNVDYATNGVRGKNESASTGSATDLANATDVATNESDSRMVGYNGSPAQLLQAYRETIINIDQMILTELEPLFIILWGSPHRIFPVRTNPWW